MKEDNFIWAVLMIIITVITGIFAALGVYDSLEPQNNSTQFEDCKVYTIDDRRGILNCSENKLLCEVMS